MFKPFNSATLTVPPATATTIGGIDNVRRLNRQRLATAPTIAAGAITLAKMANLSGTSQLHGSSSTTTSPANISLGSTLQMSGTTLSVNTSTLMLLVPSSVNGDLATLNASGQVIDSGVSINNSGLTSASLWNAAKLAVTTNYGLLEQIQILLLQQIDQQLLMFYMLEQMHLYGFGMVLYI